MPTPFPARQRAAAATMAATLIALASPCAAESPGAPASLRAAVVAFEFAVYLPTVPDADPATQPARWLSGIPGAPAAVATDPRDKPTPSAPAVSMRLERDVARRYAPPDAALVQRFGRGLTREQSAWLARSPAAVVLDFAHPGTGAAASLRAAEQVVERVARATGGLVWDEQTREVFTPDAWHERRVASWSGDRPDVPRRVVVHAYDTGHDLRAITLGMGELGLPDIVVQDFSGKLIQPMGHLVNIVAQALAEGTLPAHPGELDVDLRGIRHPAVAAEVADAAVAGPVVARLNVAPGVAEPGDPRNRLLALAFDRYPGADGAARQESMSRALFRREDDVHMVRHDAELIAARDAARRQLPALRDAFRKGLMPGESIQVKAPFTTDDGHDEWMWVEVTAWNGDAIDGLLRNEPDHVRGLHSGQAVKASQARVFDFLHRFPDGHAEGDATDEIIERASAGR